MVRDLTANVYIQLRTEFNIPLYIPGSSNYESPIRNSKSYQSKILNLEGNEILSIAWITPKSSMIYYAYIIGYYKNDTFIEVNKECALSKDFICVNKITFNDITIAFERELKINEILN